MAWSTAPVLHAFTHLVPSPSTSSSSTLFCPCDCLTRDARFEHLSSTKSRTKAVSAAATVVFKSHGNQYSPRKGKRQVCRAEDSDYEGDYEFPDPIPEFAEAETEKFRTYMLKKIAKKKDEIFGDSVEEVVRVCTEILETFLHTEYGGPGTLLVIPFMEMADALEERGLPGAPQAARAAVTWAQKHVDNDWKEWTGSND